MKKILLNFFFVLLIPSAAVAQGDNLYDMADHILAVTDATIDCLTVEGACSEEDIDFLKDDVENCRLDLMRLIKAGNASSMMLTFTQAEALRGKALDLQTKLFEIQMLDGVCNVALKSLYKAFAYLTAILGFISLAPVYGFGIFLLLFIFGWSEFLAIVFSLAGILLLPACFFWWL